jgi:hypothetical protein
MQLEDLLAMAQMPFAGHQTIEQVATAHPNVLAELRKLDPIKTAASFAGLLTTPQLQANCHRIETLIHLSVAYCDGRGTPMQGFIRRSFKSLGDGYCGMMEDPAEDVFVTLVNTPQGNFRVFEGIREGTGFCLQRILNVVEGMPATGVFSGFRTSIDSLLKLSDAVAARAAIIENSLGQENPLDDLPKSIANRLSRLRDYLRFSEHDLAQLKVSKASLAPFSMAPEDRSKLYSQQLGHTELERSPLIFTGNEIYLILPTAVGTAITRMVIEAALSIKKGKVFERALAHDFGKLFDETPILGGHSGASLIFQEIDGGQVAAIMTEEDTGRFLHLVFFVDGLNGFLEDGLIGHNANPDALSAAVTEHIKRAASDAKAKPEFRDGISILVGCGFGRAFYCGLDDVPDGWRLESLSAYNLVTLSWLTGFNGLSLWRVLDSQDAVKREGVDLLNVNGLLNLVAWSRELDGHLVPHGRLPKEFVSPGTKAEILLPLNAIRGLRHEVLAEWNPRRVLDMEGRWVRVRKLSNSEFQEEKISPLYASVDDVLKGKLRAVYVAPVRSWWIEITAPEEAGRDLIYENWMMLCTWLRRSAPVLDEAYSALPTTPVSFQVNFAEIVGLTRGSVTPKNLDELRSLFRISVEANRSVAQINIAKGFHDGLAQPENIAERVIVESLVSGTAKLAGEIDDESKRSSLVGQICPNSQARWIHRYASTSFRHSIASKLDGQPVTIDPLDAAAYKIGLGWRVRSRDAGGEISGVLECTSFLNRVVQVVLDDLCTMLKQFDRRSFVSLVLQNYEIAAHERDIWQRTAQSNLALHNDKDAAMRTIVEHISHLNGCFLASRILLEAAVCECPLTDGKTAGRLDLSRVMTLAMFAFHLGGQSDAVHWEAMEPRVKVTPLGDVHMNHSFMETVYEPFGRVGGKAQVTQAIESYEELYSPTKNRTSFADVVEPRFSDAWKAEFGVSLDGLRAFVDELENIGERESKAVFELPRADLVAALAKSAKISSNEVDQTLDVLTLKPRPVWRSVSNNFKDKDWYPWRFRRRLAVLRRPLIQIDDGDTPVVALAPGLVREAFQIMVFWFYHGAIPDMQAKSPEMSKWIGHANNVQRTKFNSSVAARMRELGWQVEPEVKLTKIVGRPLNRNYGDIDVLAWRPESGRVLAIECKDLQYLKALGEVAEQLADFRGELTSNGKPDHLRKHLDRLEVLTSHESEVSRALKLNAAIQIEGHVVFKNPVPMQFAWGPMASRVKLSLFAELDRL